MSIKVMSIETWNYLKITSLQKSLSCTCKHSLECHMLFLFCQFLFLYFLSEHRFLLFGMVMYARRCTSKELTATTQAISPILICQKTAFIYHSPIDIEWLSSGGDYNVFRVSKSSVDRSEKYILHTISEIGLVMCITLQNAIGNVLQMKMCDQCSSSVSSSIQDVFWVPLLTLSCLHWFLCLQSLYLLFVSKCRSFCPF